MPRRSTFLLVLAITGCQGAEVAPTARPVTRVELVDEPAPPDGDIARVVAAEVARAGATRVIVYVGAGWCEPCRRFHAAAERGELDARFGGTRFLAFDRDRDGDALERAGYRSTYIPLFAAPAADGTASGLQIEGSIKGEGAVDQIAPRLRALLDGAR